MRFGISISSLPDDDDANLLQLHVACLLASARQVIERLKLCILNVKKCEIVKNVLMETSAPTFILRLEVKFFVAF